jgi:SAM-dependent methyltransferase
VPENRYTHGHHESVLRSHRWRTAANSAPQLIPHLRPGQRVLDLGSGPGTITCDLAELVAPGEVVALEHTEEALALTRAEVERRGLATVTFVVGDIHALDLPDDSFDVVHAHQVLQHVADPIQALREMRRVCRPGGVVTARDADYAAFSWYPTLPALDAWMAMYQRVCRANAGEPDAGRRLLAWAHAAGLDEVTASASVWSFASPADRAYWGGMWADRVQQSALAEQALAEGHATRADLEQMAHAWRDWTAHPDGCFTVVHGEFVARV